MLLAALLLAAGCTKQTTTTNTGSAPSGGGVLRVGNWAEPTSLNPLLVTSQAETFLSSLAFDQLVTIDDKQRDIPDLAAQVPTEQNGGISKDGLTITYKLRRNVKWQDGVPFTSADVKFSWQAVMNPNNNVVERNGYDVVSSVDTPDPYTVVFHLKHKFAPFVDTVFGESDEPFGIVPKHLLDKYPDINRVPFNQQPVGTGPFKVAEWVHGDHITYVANPGYFRGAPKLKRIIVKTIPDANTTEAELRSHDIDFANDIATANLAHLRGTPGIVTLVPKGPAYFSIDLNTKRPPLDDLRVRRALAYGIDEKRIVDTLTYGTATLARAADLSPFYWAYDPNVMHYPYDPQKADQLLDQAGWKRGAAGTRVKNGQQLALQLAYGQGNTTARQMGVQIQSDLRQIGVDVQIKTYNYTVFYATKALGGILNSGKFDMAEYAWISGADPNDATQWMCDQVPPAGNNISQYCNPQFDAAERTALSHYDRATRQKAYDTTQSLLASDVPGIFQYYQGIRYAYSSAFKNFRPNGISEGWNAFEWNI